MKRKITYRCDGQFEEILLDGERLSKSDCTEIDSLLVDLCEKLGLEFEGAWDWIFEDEEG